MTGDGDLEPIAASAADDGDSIGIPLAALSIPLAALCIPLLAVAGNLGLGGAFLGLVGAVVLLLVGTAATKSVMRSRHKHRMEELRLQAALARQETAKLAEVNRMVADPAPRLPSQAPGSGDAT